jgi:response regulator RpfG family c-di-GMP phosphodiesterase
MNPREQAAGPAAYRVLVVDDEPNVRAALQRSLRAHGYDVITAESGEPALALLAQQAPHAIISDMRMPGMNGAEFLRQSRLRCPDAVRLLLTGYADVGSALRAVNEGEVFRYLTKPWDDARLAAALDEGLERHRLRVDRDRLQQLTARQNAELQQLNQDLEGRVAARSAELQQALELNEAAHQQLKGSFLATMNTFSSLVEARAGLTRGSARRVAEHVRRVGPLLGLSASEQQDTIFAALLVDLGKVVLPERLTLHAFTELQAAERVEWLKHPQHAHGLLLGIETLRGAGEILRCLHERFDGGGTPDRLAGEAIAPGTRLLTVAADYEALLAGAIVRARLQPGEALQMLRSASGKRYDPQVVVLFVESLQAPAAPARRQRRVGLDALVPGMRLAQDMLSKDGFLLLAKGQVIDAALIRQFRVHQARSDAALAVTVEVDSEVAK